MTAAANLVDRLSEKGVMMRRNGDNLILDGPVEVLTDELVEQVRRAKFDIMRTLEDRETDKRPIAGLDHLTADDCDERAAISEYDGGLPREWAEGLATLSTMPVPADIPEGKWSRIVDNAARFADRWGRQAVDLGWSLHDVFGCHPARPRERTDQAGLVWLIGNHEVVAITDDTAVLMTPTGNRLTYYRRGQAGKALIWQLCDQERPPYRHACGNGSGP